MDYRSTPCPSVSVVDCQERTNVSYATNSDIETRIGTAKYVRLTDDASSGFADETKVTQAREFAESEIDSYLARRYAVPVSTGGNADLATALRAVAVDLAVHRLHERRPPVLEDVKLRRAAALAAASFVLPQR